MAILIIQFGFFLLSVSGVLFAIGCLIVFEGERLESEKEWQETLKRTGGLSGHLSSPELELQSS